jgi:hypothetical protein
MNLASKDSATIYPMKPSQNVSFAQTWNWRNREMKSVPGVKQSRLSATGTGRIRRLIHRAAHLTQAARTEQRLNLVIYEACALCNPWTNLRSIRRRPGRNLPASPDEPFRSR